MVKKVKFEREYMLNASPNVLFPLISTPSGLSDWFCDDVNINGKFFTFFWDGSEQTAELLVKRNNQHIRFRWVDEEDPDAYFEFKLTLDEITNEVAMVVVDFAEEDEVEDSAGLWDTQIEKFRHNIGL